MLLWSCHILLAWCFCCHLQAQQALVLAGTWPGWQWPGETVPLAMGHCPEHRKRGDVVDLGGEKREVLSQDPGGECK